MLRCRTGVESYAMHPGVVRTLRTGRTGVASSDTVHGRAERLLRSDNHGFGAGQVFKRHHGVVIPLGALVGLGCTLKGNPQVSDIPALGEDGKFYIAIKSFF